MRIHSNKHESKDKQEKTRKQKAANFVIQGSILAMAGIVVRIIGMLYRMPLNDIIGKQGNGYYTSAFNVYNISLYYPPTACRWQCRR